MVACHARQVECGLELSAQLVVLPFAVALDALSARDGRAVGIDRGRRNRHARGPKRSNVQAGRLGQPKRVIEETDDVHPQPRVLGVATLAMPGRQPIRWRERRRCRDRRDDGHLWPDRATGWNDTGRCYCSLGSGHSVNRTAPAGGSANRHGTAGDRGSRRQQDLSPPQASGPHAQGAGPAPVSLQPVRRAACRPGRLVRGRRGRDVRDRRAKWEREEHPAEVPRRDLPRRRDEDPGGGCWRCAAGCPRSSSSGSASTPT